MREEEKNCSESCLSFKYCSRLSWRLGKLENQLAQQFYQSMSFVYNEALLFVAGSGVPSPIRKKTHKASENGEDKVKVWLAGFSFSCYVF